MSLRFIFRYVFCNMGLFFKSRVFSVSWGSIDVRRKLFDDVVYSLEIFDIKI